MLPRGNLTPSRISPVPKRWISTLLNASDEVVSQADLSGIVFEDAPSGIKSGVASGAKVLAVCTSHPREELEGLGATWIVQDLSR